MTFLNSNMDGWNQDLIETIITISQVGLLYFINITVGFPI
jgi:hypothetical protein